MNIIFVLITRYIEMLERFNEFLFAKTLLTLFFLYDLFRRIVKASAIFHYRLSWESLSLRFS